MTVSSILPRLAMRRGVWAALACGLLAASLPAQFFNCGATCHILSGNVYDGAGGPFLTGHVYLCNGGLTVPAGQTLSIQPGAIIKFNGVQSFLVYGTLLASGTAGAPIIITSSSDDTGGDHNGNGVGGTAVPGQWVSVWFAATAGASQISHVWIRGAGWNANPALELTSNVTATACVVDSPGGPCLNVSGATAPVVTGCTFLGGTKAAVGVTYNSLAGFSGNVATGQSVYDAPELATGAVVGAATVTVDDTFNGSGVIVSPHSASIPTAATLTFGPGVIVKHSAVLTFTVQGTLLAGGTPSSPVVFTSIHDDTAGGDTNRNGGATAPVAGQWVGLYCGGAADGTTLSSVRVRYAGWNATPAINLDAADAALNDVRTSSLGGPALGLNNNSYPSAVNCAFDGGTYAVIAARMAALPGFSGCTATGNSVFNAHYVNSGLVTPSESVAVTTDDTLNGAGTIAVATTLNVQAGGSLALDAGVVIKFIGVQAMNTYGTLSTTGSAGNPVVFTSITDDAYGGDTNQDLANSAAIPGQWVQAWFANTSSASNLQHLTIRAAGWNGNAAVEANAANITGTGIRTQICGGPGLNLNNNCTPSLTNCAFETGTYAAINVPPAAVSGLVGCTASGNSVYNAPQLGTPTINSGQSFTWSRANSFNNDGVFVLPATLAVQSGGALTLNAGVTLKFLGVHAFNCYGTLTANGTVADPITMTSIHDDAVVGDTNLNGAGSAVAPGQWVQAWFGADSDASVIHSLRIRAAGWNGNPSIELSQSDLEMTDARTALCDGPALSLNSNSFPTLSYCAFDGGSYAANAVPMGAFAGFTRCTAAGNSAANAPRVTAPTVSAGQTATIRAINTFNGSGAVHFSTTLTVHGTLDVGPGVTLKFEAVHALNAYGTIFLRGTGLEPVAVTSVHDDLYGGDSNVNGSNSSPANGQWVQLWTGASATGSLEHVVVRYAGWNGNPAIENTAAGVALKAVRSDKSGGSGIRVTAAAGTVLDDLVVWGASGEGLRVTPSRQIRHATVANCGGVGIVTTNVGTTAINSISWGNGGAGFSGFAVGAVSYSAAAGLVGGTGNVTADPQFVDATNGNLRLQTTSPCLDVAEAATSFVMVFDHDEGSRLSDGRLIGLPLPDLGAYETAAYRLSVTGKPWSGTTITLQVDGAEPGIAALAFGLGGPPEAMYPFGFLNAGPVASLSVLAIIPTGTPFPYPIPDVSAYAGGQFVIQALGVPFSNSALGAFTNVYRGVLDG
jgi:hypothetical protein